MMATSMEALDAIALFGLAASLTAFLAGVVSNLVVPNIRRRLVARVHIFRDGRDYEIVVDDEDVSRSVDQIRRELMK